MNNFIKRTMTISQRLSVGEIGLMKLYIIICGIILSIWIPALRTVSRWIWAIAAAIMIIPLLIQEFQQHPHYISQMFKGTIKPFAGWGMWQFTMFKTGIVIIGILLTYIIPGLLHINIARYTALWGLGAGYFLDHILRK